MNDDILSYEQVDEIKLKKDLASQFRFVKVENSKPFDYTIEQLFVDHPDAEIYEYSMMPSEKLLAEYNVFPLITTPRPEGDVVIEGEPVLINGEWNQTWIARKFNEIEKKENIGKIKEYQLKFFVSDELRSQRYEICKSCDKFVSFTKQCKECKCFMKLKTKFKMASCPLGKW